MLKRTASVAFLIVVASFSPDFAPAGDSASTKAERDVLQILATRIATNDNVGNSVSIRVELRASEPLWLPNWIETNANLEVIIHGPDGKRIPHLVGHVRYAPLARADFLRLLPGHFFGRDISIAGSHFGEKGEYRIRVNYYSDDDGSGAGVDAWTGSVYSGTLSLSPNNS